jgi:hypothetical protein
MERSTVELRKLMIMSWLKFELIVVFLLFYRISYSSNFGNEDDKKNKKFFSIVELGIYKGLDLSTDYPSGISGSDAYAKRLRLVTGYFLNPHLSAGIGFGADRYECPGANTLPLFLDLRGYLQDAKNTPFVFFDFGKTIVFSSQAQEGGNLFDGGVGYKFFVWRKTCLITKIGYNYFNNKEWTWQSTDMTSLNPAAETYRWFYLKRESITFSIGLMF